MLTRKDWRNAIHLALQMGQPRRLLGLFTHVNNNRAEGRRNGLLASALAAGDGDEDVVELGEDDDAALRAAGIRTRRRTAPKTPNGPSNDADAASITGLASVDSIISTLPPQLLIQLLLYIRDWNTSTRTAPIAQTLLHAILSTHTAASLLDIFDASTKSHRAALAERLENEELGIVAP